MKTVITSQGNTVKSKFDLRFGRAAWFCIFNQETGEIVFHENKNKDASNGAGTKASQKMVDLEINKIISGDFGPKAQDLLEKFNIQMIIIQDENKSVQDIINQLSKNS